MLVFNLVDIFQRASAVCFICSLKCQPEHPPPPQSIQTQLFDHTAQHHGWHEYLISIYYTWSCSAKQKRLLYERTNMKLGFIKLGFILVKDSAF